jgi:hypothetical protein
VKLIYGFFVDPTGDTFREKEKTLARELTTESSMLSFTFTGIPPDSPWTPVIAEGRN